MPNHLLVGYTPPRQLTAGKLDDDVQERREVVMSTELLDMQRQQYKYNASTTIDKVKKKAAHTL